ncbi:MAG: hypothetical protein JST54_03720 [Deltaproteobacteria bacterium]|nr:hypothetical protein [Deltaproteobacteria bacterium]
MRTLVFAIAALLSAPAFAQTTPTTPGSPNQLGGPVNTAPGTGLNPGQPCVGIDCNQMGTPSIGVSGAQPCVGINCSPGTGLSGSSSTQLGTTPGSALGQPATTNNNLGATQPCVGADCNTGTSFSGSQQNDGVNNALNPGSSVVNPPPPAPPPITQPGVPPGTPSENTQP